MFQYAIVAFPESDVIEAIEDLRSRYDPQFGLIPAHVTLVFPFSDNSLAAQLNEIVREAIDGMGPIEMELENVTEADDGYIFLGIGLGRDTFVELHDSLYRGRLSRYLSKTHIYLPHVTIGRLADVQARQAAVAHARQLIRPTRATVRGLSVFRLESPSKGQTVSSIPFDRRA
jgi:2'-5' RNA ligase